MTGQTLIHPDHAIVAKILTYRYLIFLLTKFIYLSHGAADPAATCDTTSDCQYKEDEEKPDNDLIVLIKLINVIFERFVTDELILPALVVNCTKLDDRLAGQKARLAREPDESIAVLLEREDLSLHAGTRFPNLDHFRSRGRIGIIDSESDPNNTAKLG